MAFVHLFPSMAKRDGCGSFRGADYSHLLCFITTEVLPNTTSTLGTPDGRAAFNAKCLVPDLLPRGERQATNHHGLAPFWQSKPTEQTKCYSVLVLFDTKFAYKMVVGVLWHDHSLFVVAKISNKGICIKKLPLSYDAAVKIDGEAEKSMRRVWDLKPYLVYFTGFAQQLMSKCLDFQSRIKMSKVSQHVAAGLAVLPVSLIKHRRWRPSNFGC